MTYRLSFARSAATYLSRLDRPTQERMARLLRLVAEDPYGHGTKVLTNARGLRAARVGTWRIVFRVDDDLSELRVELIGPRGQIYRDL